MRFLLLRITSHYLQTLLHDTNNTDDADNADDADNTNDINNADDADDAENAEDTDDADNANNANNAENTIGWYGAVVKAPCPEACTRSGELYRLCVRNSQLT